MSRRRKDAKPAEPPSGAARRLAKVGAAGAGALGRTAVSGLRKLGASPERQAAIDRATREANALDLVDTLAQLRGPLMKLGQLLSQQAHSLPETWIHKLAELQRSAPPMHGSLARLQFRRELGRNPEDVLDSFEREAFAAASLGQVHRARLGSTDLAVKIQYPGIERSIGSDLALLEGMFRAAGWSARHPELRAMLDEVRLHLEQEADYVQEADRMEELRQALADEEDVRIPRVWRELSARRVLTMERLEGLHVEELLRAGPSQEERDRLAARLLALFFRQTLDLGLFQADTHPGNFLFLPEGRIGLLDFGCTKRLDPGFVAEQRRLYRIPAEDEAALTESYLRLGLLQEGSAGFDERLALLLRMQRVDGAKYHRTRPFDFSDGVYLRELAACLRDFLRSGLVHPDLVLYVRAKLGLYNLFHQLGAHVHCGRAIEPYL